MEAPTILHGMADADVDNFTNFLYKIEFFIIIYFSFLFSFHFGRWARRSLGEGLRILAFGWQGRDGLGKGLCALTRGLIGHNEKKKKKIIKIIYISMIVSVRRPTSTLANFAYNWPKRHNWPIVKRVRNKLTRLKG